MFLISKQLIKHVKSTQTGGPDRRDVVYMFTVNGESPFEESSENPKERSAVKGGNFGNGANEKKEIIREKNGWSKNGV